MDKNIGNFIKTFAIVELLIGVILSVVGGVELGRGSALYVFIFLYGAIILFMFTYGFGELIDTNCKLVNITSGICVKDETLEDEKISKIERLRKIEYLRQKNLITDEEYQNYMSKG